MLDTTPFFPREHPLSEAAEKLRGDLQDKK